MFKFCDFTGCKFIGTNFRGSKFSGCKFDYSTFERTFITSDILNTECPPFENLKLDFARTLRVNFNQIGDTEGANKAILLELEASEIHLWKVWASNESYYRDKYKGFYRVIYFFKWANFKLFDYIWGNGEKPHKLVLAALLFLFIISALELVSSSGLSYKNVADSILVAPQLFMGTVEGKRRTLVYNYTAF